MRPAKLSLILVLCLAICSGAASEDKKKHMIVEAGAAARQVNNHPRSYTTNGQSNTTCSGSGNVNGTAIQTSPTTTNVSGTVDTNTDCSTTYRPPQTVHGNRVTVDNAAWVTDVATGDQYLIQCTANWVGSKCSYLTGGRYAADVEGNTMWINGMKGMKKETAKYHVLQFVKGSATPVTSASASPAAVRQSSTQSSQSTMTNAPTPSSDAEVQISSDPSGADIELDGNFVGNTPSTLKVAAGNHSIRMIKNGYTIWDRKIVVTRGQINVSAELIPLPNSPTTDATNRTDQAVKQSTPQSPPSAALVMTSDPSGAEIYADGTLVGKTPMRLGLAPGQHYLRLFMNDYKNWSQLVTVAAGPDIQVDAKLEKSDH